MNKHELQYHNLLQEVLKRGKKNIDRTGVGTISLFRPKTMQFYIDNGNNFPLFTRKFVNFKAIVKELLWFLSGSNNINDLDSTIWNDWASEDGSIGTMYGSHFRDIDGQDPYMDIIDGIREEPHSRRHCMSTWRHSLLPLKGIRLTENSKIGRGNLACCWGTAIQWYINDNNELDMSTYQRSGDLGLGVFFNIPQQALLLLITAKLTGYKAGTLYYDIGDSHIYNNHIDGIKEYLARPFLHSSPSVKIDDIKNIPKFENIHLIGYNYQPKIKLPIAI